MSLTVSASRTLRDARYRVFARFGDAPYRSGEESESSEANARHYERRWDALQRERASILRDFRKDLGRASLDTGKRGKGNRAWKRANAIDRATPNYCPFWEARAIMHDFAA